MARIFGWLTVLWISLLVFSFLATPAHPAGVTRVFDCSGPDCSRLTAKTNDYLDMGSGTQSQPCVESTSAPTGACAASACVYDTSNSKLYFCGASGWAEIAGGGGGGSSAFSAITTGENTGQTLEVGSGSTLKPKGLGLIGANRTFNPLRLMAEDKTITTALDFIKWVDEVEIDHNLAFPVFVNATGTFHYDVEPFLNLGPSFFSFQPTIEIDTAMTITGANAFFANPQFKPLGGSTLTLLGGIPTIFSGFKMENSGGGSVAPTSDIVQYGTGGSVESGFTLDRVLGYECGAPVAAGTITNRSCFVANAQTTATNTVGFETLGTIDYGVKIADGSSVGIQVNNSAYAIDINDGGVGITIDSTSGTALAINPDAGQIAIDINGGGTGVDIAAGVTTGIVNASKTVYSPGTAVDPGTSTSFTVTKTVTEFSSSTGRNPILLANGVDGQVTTFVNVGTGNMVFHNGSNSNMRLTTTSCQTLCANYFVNYCSLSTGDTLTALYLDSLSDWVVISCSNNG
ncbi:MAG: hypothetical protein CMH53_07000 [Myxococcales bacterium]|nr:hypothetical protein [Myxococcales bacterium]